MKKLLAVCAVVCLTVNFVFAGSFDKFNTILDAVDDGTAQKLLDNLASDMGAVMTGGNFGVSTSLGFLNLSANLKVSNINVSNEIMRNSGTSEMYLPILSLHLGLPYRFGILGKYGYGYDSNLYGLGLRYTVYESSMLAVPSVSVQGMYSLMQTRSNGNNFDTNDINLGACATFDQIPFVTPYVSVGWDKVKLKPKSSNKQNLTGEADNFGYGLGVAVNIVTFHLSCGVSWYRGVPNYTFGLNLSI